MTWLRRPTVPGWDKVSATRARRSGSSIRVKQLPSFAKRMPLVWAWQATYSWPLRMTCAPNGGLTAHLDRQVSPGRVHDVEGVVVDVLPGLLQVADYPRTRPFDLPHDGRRPGHEDQENAHSDGVLTQILFGDPVFAFPGLAVDHRHPVLPGPGPYPPGEPSRQPHQVRVVQLFVAVLMPTTPPHPKPARVGSQRIVGVEHDPIHT